MEVESVWSGLGRSSAAARDSYEYTRYQLLLFRLQSLELSQTIGREHNRHCIATRDSTLS